MNLNYKRSRNRESQLKKKLESEGYYAIRAAGSKGNADVIAIKPAKCGNALHYEVRFLQVKVSENIRSFKHIYKIEDSPCGEINVEYLKYPVKSKKYYEHYSRSKRRTYKKKPKS